MLLFIMRDNIEHETRKTYITLRKQELDGALSALRAQGVPGRRTVGQMRDIVEAAYRRLLADLPENLALSDFVKDNAVIDEFYDLTRFHRHPNRQAIRLLDMRAVEEILAAANAPIPCSAPDCSEAALDDDDLCVTHRAEQTAKERANQEWLAAHIDEVLARTTGDA
jgi:hypothetical protein